MTTTEFWSFPPARVQSAEERRAELCRDIGNAGIRRGSFVTSNGAPATRRLSASLFLNRPTILRRAAALLADSVPRATDRLVGYRRSAVPLVVAVALETGLPFALLDFGEPLRPQVAHRAGEIGDNERFLLLTDVLNTRRTASCAERYLKPLGCRCLGVLAAVDLREDSALGGPQLIGALCRGGELRW